MKKSSLLSQGKIKVLPKDEQILLHLLNKLLEIGQDILQISSTEQSDQICLLCSERDRIKNAAKQILDNRLKRHSIIEEKIASSIKQDQEILELLEYLKQEVHEELLETKKIRRNLEKYSVNKNESRKIDF